MGSNGTRVAAAIGSATLLAASLVWAGVGYLIFLLTYSDYQEDYGICMEGRPALAIAVTVVAGTGIASALTGVVGGIRHAIGRAAFTAFTRPALLALAAFALWSLILGLSQGGTSCE